MFVQSLHFWTVAIAPPWANQCNTYSLDHQTDPALQSGFYKETKTIHTQAGQVPPTDDVPLNKNIDLVLPL